jgi:hypothetical protein
MNETHEQILQAKTLTAYFQPGRELYRKWLIEYDTAKLLYSEDLVSPRPKLPAGSNDYQIAMEYNAEKN